ncbi:MarR family transcriptional regulator [Nocardia sp. R6R-6]|uniref:MarR family transcriptional regulator n=1 Tax=Nocardia sp. R6R-6 TaxID=3459303 RepID=UPI00403D8B83
MNRRSAISGTGEARDNTRPSRMRDAAPPSLRGTAFVTDDFLPYLLNQVINVWDRRWKRALKSTAVNTRQWRVLSILCRTPGLSLTELVDKTAIDQPTLSRMIDQLNTLGLVKREVAQQDARFLQLSLTAAGESLVEDVWPVAWENYRIGVGDLSPEEEAVLIKLLNRVLNSVRAE